MADDQQSDEKRMSVGGHLDELRKRLIYIIVASVVSTMGCLYFAPHIIAFLKRPYVSVMTRLGLEPNLAVLDVAAGLANYIKVAFFAGIVIAFPFIFYHVWAFISVGLYRREKHYARLAVPFCTLLFAGGALFFVLVVAERVLYFLLALTVWLGMVPIITFENFLSFMLRMMVVFALAFQSPLVILILVAMGVVTTKTLNRYRRHVIVAILILAALFTPPDPVSQLALAVPMWLLYELGLILAYLLVTRRRRKRADRGPE